MLLFLQCEMCSEHVCNKNDGLDFLLTSMQFLSWAKF